MSKPLSDQELILAAAGKMWVNCEYLHKGHCIPYWLNAFTHSLIFSLKFYLPLNIFSMLVRYKQLLSKPRQSIKIALFSAIRASLVLSTMVLLAKIIICTYVKFSHKGDARGMIFASLGVIPATLIETTGKISDLSLYVMPRFFDAFWKFISRRNLMKPIKGLQIVLFCLSTSVIAYSTHIEPDIIKPMLSNMCKSFLGIN